MAYCPEPLLLQGFVSYHGETFWDCCEGKIRPARTNYIDFCRPIIYKRVVVAIHYPWQQTPVSTACHSGRAFTRKRATVIKMQRHRQRSTARSLPLAALRLRCALSLDLALQCRSCRWMARMATAMMAMATCYTIYSRSDEHLIVFSTLVYPRQKRYLRRARIHPCTMRLDTASFCF